MAAEKRYFGAALTVSFDGRLCIHSHKCALTLPEVLRANVAGDWINPEGAPPKKVGALARRCPSGAIRVEVQGEELAVRPSRKNSVEIIENGPTALRGGIKIAESGQWCRATFRHWGASKHKPFCDGRHVGGGFVASGEVASDENLDDYPEHAALDLTPAKDGPLLVKKPAEVESGGSGRALRHGQRWLCTAVASHPINPSAMESMPNWDFGESRRSLD